MTAQTSDNEQTKSALLFTAILTVAAGAAGMALAGVILGFDYMLRGEPDGRERVEADRAEQRRARYEDALAWLEADRADRAARRKQKREWFEADPATRGDAPSGGETFGRVAARIWNSTVVGAGRFRRGWRAGREEAQQRRDAGDANWWQPQRRTADAPQPQDVPEPQPEPATRPAPGWNPPHDGHGRTPGNDDIIDAELVPDVEVSSPQPGADVVPVGTADTDRPDLGVDGYAHRIETLHTEVIDGRSSRNDDPSPPRSALI